MFGVKYWSDLLIKILWKGHFNSIPKIPKKTGSAIFVKKIPDAKSQNSVQLSYWDNFDQQLSHPARSHNQSLKNQKKSAKRWVISSYICSMCVCGSFYVRSSRMKQGFPIRIPLHWIAGNCSKSSHIARNWSELRGY